MNHRLLGSPEQPRFLDARGDILVDEDRRRSREQHQAGLATAEAGRDFWDSFGSALQTPV